MQQEAIIFFIMSVLNFERIGKIRQKWRKWKAGSGLKFEV